MTIFIFSFLTMKAIQRQITGYTGVFFAAGKLGLRNLVVSLTWGGYPDVDVVALNPQNDKRVSIQVKSHSARNSWYPLSLGKSDFYVFVDISRERIDYSIMPTTLVRSMATKNLLSWQKSHPNEKYPWLDAEQVEEHREK